MQLFHATTFNPLGENLVEKATKLEYKMEGTQKCKATDSFLHNFADDMAIIAETREETEEVATQLYQYLQGFLVDLHVATPTSPKSKSVVLFLPATKNGPEIQNSNPITVNHELQLKINFTKTAKYLGHIISDDLSDEHHINSRMSKASQVFGALRPHLFGKKEVW